MVAKTSVPKIEKEYFYNAICPQLQMQDGNARTKLQFCLFLHSDQRNLYKNHVDTSYYCPARKVLIAPEVVT